MIAAIYFASFWGVAQLAFLGSRTRTVKASTLFLAVAAGMFAAAPLALLLQLAWTRPFAWLAHVEVRDVTSVASYTLDPIIEEAVKILPLILLTSRVSAVRTWSFIDYVVVGAAVGSGFGLAECIYRAGSLIDSTPIIPAEGGWERMGLMDSLIVPHITTSLVSWLPAGMAPADAGLNVHLAWSSMAGLAVALYIRSEQRVIKILAATIFAYVCFDHAAVNASLSYVSHPLLQPLLATFQTMRTWLWVGPLIALLIAAFLDNPTEVIKTASNDRRPSLREYIHSRTRQPKTYLWLALSAPPFLFLIVGGWPKTKAIQHLLLSQPWWTAVLWICIGALVWLAVAVVLHWSEWRSRLRRQHASAVSLGLRLASACGAIFLGSLAIAKIFNGAWLSEGVVGHVLDAAGSADTALALLIAASCVVLFPDLGSGRTQAILDAVDVRTAAADDVA